MQTSHSPNSFKALAAAICAFTMWGALVLFWHMLDGVPPFEILCYRILCSLLVVTPLLFVMRRGSEALRAFRSPRTLIVMLCSSTMIALNWFLYIWAISNGMVLETSLGYYINPLMCVLMGFVFLKERPSRLQTFSIGLACVGVGWSVVGHGAFPWLALSIAASFATYGLIRKLAPIEALPGMFIETLFLAPVAAAFVIYWYVHGQGVLAHPNWREGILLFLSGPVTSLPLVLFAYAARNLKLMTVGLVQYISPTCTFFIGVWILHEPLPGSTLITFGFIWCALIVYTAESLRLNRR